MTNIVRMSGVQLTPVTSLLVGPVRKRRISPVRGSHASFWLLPMRSISPLYITVAWASVWIHNTPRESNAMPSGEAKISPLILPFASGRALAGSPARTR